MRNLARDPVLLGLVALTSVASLLFFLVDSGRTPIYWAAQVPLDAVLAVGGFRLRRLAPPRYRRFWTSIGFAGVCFTFGDTFQFVMTLTDPAGTSLDGGTVQSAFFTVGMCSNVLACLIFPQGLSSGREKLVFWLDAATVLVGGGVMAWCFAVNPFDENTDRVTASLTAALVVVAAFSATKVALIPRPPMARIAAWPMVAAPMVQGVSTFLPGAFQSHDQPYVYAVRLLPSLLIAVGPRLQELVVRVDGTRARRERRPYSLLPYAMIGLTFVIFFIAMPDDITSRFRGATIGVVVITLLVAARQLVAFQDNIGLIRRLDDALRELKSQQGLLRKQASTDELTRLANRSRFAGELARAPGGHAVLLIDLDDFKTVNDTLGHAAGDALLAEVAGRLLAAVRESDLVARLGGDEFAVLLQATDEQGASRVADDILLALSRPVTVAPHSLTARASIGVALARPGDEPSALLSNADIAMYEAKRRGKSLWVTYTADLGRRISADADLVRDLEHAVEHGEFQLVYQPIVRLATGEMTGVETLIRWHHPQRGIVSPEEFIPLAERSGLIVPIGAFVLREACRQAASWRALHPRYAAGLTVGVNVAGRQLQTGHFPDEVEKALTSYGLPASSLTIEVTETAVLDDEESHEALRRLRALGVSLALDDFGTAASSLGLLLTCPVTTLKLDRSFVEAITTVERQAAVATAVSQMADALQLSSVAEGIETEEQRELLQKLGYQYGQGYLFSRPVPAHEISARWTAAALLPDRP